MYLTPGLPMLLSRQVSRLKRVAGQVNADYGVAGLCRELPARVEELVRRGGGKLRK